MISMAIFAMLFAHKNIKKLDITEYSMKKKKIGRQRNGVDNGLGRRGVWVRWVKI
jgi:hypothetical protein